MTPSDIPSEHVYCVKGGRKHHDLFTTLYAGENYCSHRGLANPFQSRSRARSRTPAFPGPHDEVVEVRDSPPQRAVSPASQLLRKRIQSTQNINGGYAQLLPNEISAPNVVRASARARLHLSKPASSSSNPTFVSAATAASQAIQNTKSSSIVRGCWSGRPQLFIRRDIVPSLTQSNGSAFEVYA